MTTRERLLQEIQDAPDLLVEEVLNFLLFTKLRRQWSNSEMAIQPSAETQQPIWDAFTEFADQLPDAIADTLPQDGAAQLDHYLYASISKGGIKATA